MCGITRKIQHACVSTSILFFRFMVKSIVSYEFCHRPCGIFTSFRFYLPNNTYFPRTFGVRRQNFDKIFYFLMLKMCFASPTNYIASSFSGSDVRHNGEWICCANNLEYFVPFLWMAGSSAHIDADNFGLANSNEVTDDLRQFK